MAITRNIEIDGREVPFKASAATPRIYRARTGRDLFVDLNRLMNAVEVNDESVSMLDTASLETFEDIAWVMARAADPGAPDTPEAWLDQFDTFSIYQILPQLLALWGLNVETGVESKKNSNPPTDR